MKKILAILVLLMASTVWAAGTVTVTESGGSGDALVVQFAWVGNATGGEVPSTSSSTVWPTVRTGCIFALETNPGTTAPTDNYDITITDSDGVDLLGGQGANRDTANSEMILAKVGSAFACAPTQGAFTFNLTGNVVNSATGTAKIYIYEDTE